MFLLRVILSQKDLPRLISVTNQNASKQCYEPVYWKDLLVIDTKRGKMFAKKSRVFLVFFLIG